MYVKSFIDSLGDFIEQVYKVDCAVIAAHYPEWLTLGKGADHYLSVPELPTDNKGGSFLLAGGYLENGDFSKYRPITSHNDAFLIDGIKESGKHAWYKDDEPLAPWEGLTRPNYTGWQEDGKYTWVKAPTFYGKTVEVGPLACSGTNSCCAQCQRYHGSQENGAGAGGVSYHLPFGGALRMSERIEGPAAVAEHRVDEETLGFVDSPAVWLEAAFTRVARSDMQSLPFYRAAIPVKACGFTLFEQQWVGCLLTPVCWCCQGQTRLGHDELPVNAWRCNCRAAMSRFW